MSVWFGVPAWFGRDELKKGDESYKIFDFPQLEFEINESKEMESKKDDYSLEDLKQLKEELKALEYDLERAKTEEAQKKLVKEFNKRTESLRRNCELDKLMDYFIEKWDLKLKDFNTGS